MNSKRFVEKTIVLSDGKIIKSIVPTRTITLEKFEGEARKIVARMEKRKKLKSF